MAGISQNKNFYFFWMDIIWISKWKNKNKNKKYFEKLLPSVDWLLREVSEWYLDNKWQTKEKLGS